MDEDAAPPADKPGLRRWAVARRQGLDVAALSHTLTARLRGLPEWDAARRVLLYLAMPGEVAVEGLISETGKAWHVPRCAPARRLAVHPFTPGGTPLRAGPWGIREPDPACAPEAAPEALDLVVVPSLLLTPDGDRLGYGGGYYDRLLPRLRPECVRVGLLPDALLVPRLPRDPWDVPLHLVVTETRVFRPTHGERL